MRALVACLLASTLCHAQEPRLLDVAGKPVQLSSLQTDVTVFAFWATFCPPCIDELPSLEALAKALGPRTAVLAVSIDPQARHEQIRTVAADKKLTLPVLHDVDRMLFARFFPRMTATGNVSVPQLVIVDARGRGFTSDGFDPDERVSDYVARLERVVARVRAGSRRADEGWHRIGR